MSEEHPAAKLATSLLCKDGIERSDCVVVVETSKGRMGDDVHWGKPMVGWIYMLSMEWRMCHDCFELFGGYRWLEEHPGAM